MGKSAKARKAKKADFQKVKIKVGKKLKKAQNETKTDFKARKIILKEQLAVKATKTLVTKKQHDISELLSRLNYHNVYVRQDGINGLRELVNRYEPSLLLPHLSTFIVRGAPAILDPDPLIRSSAVKFLEAIIMKMGPSIEPYFNVLATHLSCAMVHLNIGVQGDSLQLIKVLIKYTPKLMAKHANTVLSNFLNLIARKATSSKQTQTKQEPSKPIVTFNFATLLQPKVKNPLAGHAGRLALLVELSNFLEAILTEHGRMQKEIPFTVWDTVLLGSVPPVICDDYSVKADELWLFTDVEKLEDFTNTVIRLLMQLWLEVDNGNNEDSSAGGNALNEEGVETLSCIVNIIMHIWRITQICTQEHPRKCHWLRAHFSSNFMMRIMAGFPFCCQVSALKSKKRKNKESQSHEDESSNRKLKHCDDLNVLLSLFGTQMSLKSHRLKATNYLSQLLRDGNRDGQYNMAGVVKIIKELLPPAKEAEVQSIISAAHTCFVRLHPLKKDRAILLDLLLEVLDKEHEYMLSYTSVVQWIEQIVKDLVAGDVRERELQVVISLRLRNNTNIWTLLISEKDKILEAVRKKGVHGLTAEELEMKLKFILKE
ncbi:testis-expressed protein 10 homolog [Palaemon carinicauda]|uniref:testis-expressed protein 10 homolog n=1 Tax=Palaemon carinicauda TaxID=392227 RepID=UPI0035B68950